MSSLNYSIKNISNIQQYSEFVDHNFITTDPSVLNSKINKSNFHFFFVPVDKNIESFDVFKMKPKKDLFYAMSHGVNRATLKEGVEDDRINFLNKFFKKITNNKYDFYGFANKPPIWGNEFNNALVNSQMGLNLSRGKPTKYYSSNRIASIMGNGLLTFIDKRTQYNNFFSNNEMIFYNNIDDLVEKINRYKNDSKSLKRIAKNGHKKYHKFFNSNIVAKFIIDKTFGLKSNIFWE